MKNITTEFIIRGQENLYVTKYKESEKAICFTYTERNKKYYVWTPKKILKNCIIGGRTLLNDFAQGEHCTRWILKIPLKYFSISYSHYVKKNK